MLHEITVDEAIELSEFANPCLEYNPDLLRIYKRRLEKVEDVGATRANFFATSRFFANAGEYAPSKVVLTQTFAAVSGGFNDYTLHPFVGPAVCLMPLLGGYDHHLTRIETLARDLKAHGLRHFAPEPAVMQDTYVTEYDPATFNARDPHYTYSECPVAEKPDGPLGADPWETFLGTIVDGKRRKKLRAYARSLTKEGYRLEEVPHGKVLRWMVEQAAIQHGWDSYANILHLWPAALAEIDPTATRTFRILDPKGEPFSVMTLVRRPINSQRMAYLHSFVSAQGARDVGRASLCLLVQAWLNEWPDYMDILDTTFGCDFTQNKQNLYKRAVCNKTYLVGAAGASVNRAFRDAVYYSAKHGWVLPEQMNVIGASNANY